MDHKKRYLEWKEMALNEEIAAELFDIEEDETEIESRFSSELKFGTAGLRSKLEIGRASCRERV